MEVEDVSGVDRRVETLSEVDGRVEDVSGVDRRVEDVSGVDRRVEDVSGVERRVETLCEVDGRVETLLRTSRRDDRVATGISISTITGFRLKNFFSISLFLHTPVAKLEQKIVEYATLTLPFNLAIKYIIRYTITGVNNPKKYARIVIQTCFTSSSSSSI